MSSSFHNPVLRFQGAIQPLKHNNSQDILLPVPASGAAIEYRHWEERFWLLKLLLHVELLRLGQHQTPRNKYGNGYLSYLPPKFPPAKRDKLQGILVYFF